MGDGLAGRQPVLFLSHGSPLTALGGDELGQVWAGLAERLSRPEAIVVVSAHWESSQPLIGGNAAPETIHDFGGFPSALYQLAYLPPGQPALARCLRDRLVEQGLQAGIDPHRGLDHGAWVPLRALFPAADIPVVPLSIQPALGVRHHYAVGEALAGLAEENILILASGHLTHNLREFFHARGGGPSEAARSFREWAHSAVMAGEDEMLLDWASAPGAMAAHPSDDHLMPLFVALGASGRARRAEALGGGWVGGALAADNYLFFPAARV